MTHLPLPTRRFARLLRTITLAAMAALGAVAVYALLQPHLIFDAATARFAPNGIPMWDIGTLAKALLLLLGAIALAAILFTLWRMARLFGLYAQGDALSGQAAREIRLTALGLLAQAAIKILGHTATGLVLSIDAPVGHRVLAIGIGSPEIGFALAGGLLLLIGVVMQQAIAIAEENKGFV